VNSVRLACGQEADRPIPSPGRRLRRAARILLFDPDQRLLLFRFAPDKVAPFWCTPGGECEPGEPFHDAAIRELREETGIEAHPGPEIRRIVADFVIFTGEPITADERYFVVRTAASTTDTSGHTELEQAIMQHHRWFSRDEIAGWHEPIFPGDLHTMLADFSA